MSAVPTLMRRTKSRSDSLLPISAPPTSDARGIGIAVTTVCLLMGASISAVYMLLPLSHQPQSGGEVQLEAARVAEARHEQLATAATARLPAESAISATGASIAPSAGSVDSASSESTAPCRDVSSRCEEWAAQGECSRNEPFMHKKCMHSCGLCGSEQAPRDGHAERTLATGAASATTPTERAAAKPDWSSLGFSMSQTSKCAAWAKNGECERNPKWMCHDVCASFCPETCAGLRNDQRDP